MDSSPSLAQLTPRLDALLGAISDKGFAERLRAIYLAAARGIERLGSLDIVKYEEGLTDSSADLSLWEEMAPLLRDTVEDVNALIGAIRERFPAGSTTAGTGLEAKRLQVVEQALRLGAEDLMREVTRLGERMRSPAIVSDRWNLLGELQSFRSRFREQLSNLVYETADTISPVTREEVVPGLAEDVRTAAVVRGTVTDLKRVLAARAQKVREAEKEDVQWNAQQLEKELDSFGRTPAYRWLQVPDKRQVVEQRAALAKLATQAQPHPPEMVAVVEALAALMEDASSRPHPLLEEHDRQVWAAVGVCLEQATVSVDTDSQTAAQLLTDGVTTAQKLYGRSASLDAFVRKYRRQSLAELPAQELPKIIEELREILAGISVV